MKQLLFFTTIISIYILFARCAKDEIHKGNSDLQLDQVVETRSGLNANRPTFFLTSGTWSNYMMKESLPDRRVYRAYNYGLVDSITLLKVSAGNAMITYQGTNKYMAANFNITIHYNNGLTDTLNNVLSKFNGQNSYTFIPDPDKDQIHFAQPNVVYVLWTQRSSHVSVMLPHNGVVQKVHNWDNHQWTGLTLRNIGRNSYPPTRPNDFEYMLNDVP